MQTLSHVETGQTAGGILYTTPVAVAIMDSASFGPLVGAFGVGWTIGTFIYNNWISE